MSKERRTSRIREGDLESKELGAANNEKVYTPQGSRLTKSLRRATGILAPPTTDRREICLELAVTRTQYYPVLSTLLILHGCNIAAFWFG